MPGATSPYNLPYPLPADPISATDVQDLAEAVDALAVQTLAALDAATDGIRAAIVSGGPAVVVAGPGSVQRFSTEVLDTSGLVDLATAPTQININATGIWVLNGLAAWAAESGTGPRGCSLLVNGTTVARSSSAHPTDFRDGGWSLGPTYVGSITSGSSVQLNADHGTGTVGVTTRTVSSYRLVAVKLA